MTRLKRKKELPSSNTNDVRFGTPELVAQYRAERLGALKPDTIIEVGAGAGFQTAAFAKVAGRVIAVEIDEERLGRASLAPNVTPIAGDALDPAVLAKVKASATGRIMVFLDPERPAESAQRTIEEIRPDIGKFIAAYGTITQDIAIELPPFLARIPLPCEREYLSIDGKLNRLTIYLGGLKRAQTAVVQLPAGARVERNDAPAAVSAQRSIPDPKFILEPDAALAHADIAHTILDEQGIEYATLALGRRTVYLAREAPDSPFFAAHRVLAVGETRITQMLPHANCATVILHGPIGQEEQRALLQRLNRFCKGKRRLHLFLGRQWYLTHRAAA